MADGPSLLPPGDGNGYHNGFIARVADSFRRVTGGSLDLRVALSDPLLGKNAYLADFALLTHRGDADATLNYGNALALRLWECDWARFTATPSRKTAPAEAEPARDEMMARVARDNFAAGYSGMRISATGRLFRIKNVTVWRLLDEAGKDFGVGAVFRDYEYL